MFKLKQIACAGLLLLMLSLPLGIASAQSSDAMVIIYKGVTMTQEQLQELKQGAPFYCVQEVTQTTIETRSSNVFYCFDTEAEVDQKYNELLPLINQLFATSAASQAAYSQDSQLMSGGHWAVYARVAYADLITDIYRCSGVVTNSSIYSLRTWYGPTFSLEVTTGPNFTGQQYIYSTDAYFLTSPYYSARAYNQLCA